MDIKISESFDYKKLLRFTLPSIVMMIFTSIYGVVDGFFVSTFAKKTAFAAVNFIMPYLMILGTLGFMIGAGGSALVAKTLGEGDKKRANEYFSLLIYVSVIAGIVLSFFGILFLRPIASLLGAEGELLEMCVRYGRIVLLALPFFMVQMACQSFFVTAEKPKIGLIATVAAGVTNIILDALLVGLLSYKLEGAAVATAISQTVGGIFPLIYFSRNNSSLLRLSKTKFSLYALVRTATNGSSELMSNISMSLVNMLYNIQLFKYAGEDGVAAFGVIMYVNFVFISIFFGYAVGSAPIVGYHFGAKNRDELKNILKKSLVITGACSLLMFILSESLASPLSYLFVGYDEGLTALTRQGFMIFSFSFLFAGFAIYGSSFFTALNDGLTSAVISFMRTLVFQIAAVLLLPLLFEVVGIWISLVVAEVMAMALVVFFLLLKRKKYGY
ncbi:MAG: MATE family efflux transporter [Clostridia bacterium]|nr:MATE family efflux transporter [Clostridia bacterium]